MQSIFADRTREQLEDDAARYLDILDIWQQEAVAMTGRGGSADVRVLMEIVKLRIAQLPQPQ